MRGMDWPDDVLDEQASRIAGAVLTLLSDPLRWRHRRVETITLLSATLQRRRVSVDLTVPSGLHDSLLLGRAEDRRWVVPVAWLARRQLVKFDLLDREGSSAPLLLGAQTASITRDLLLIAADRAAGARRHPPGTLEVVLEAASDQRPASSRALVARAEALGLGDDFVSLVRSSANGFLLLAVVREIAGRQIVKWQTDELHPPTGFVNRSGLAGLNEAASTHVELELPDFVAAPSFELFDDRTSPEHRVDAVDDVRLESAIRAPSSSDERPRLLLAPEPGARRPHVRAQFELSSAEFIVPAVVLTVVACVFLLTGLATDIGADVTAPDAGTASIAATVLLAAFAALSGLVLRVESHPLVRTLLGRSRMALGLTAFGLVVAAAPLGLQLDRTTVMACWGIGAAAALGALGMLVDDMIEHTPIGRRLALARSVRRADHTD
jgi:hypothetical protein